MPFADFQDSAAVLDRQRLGKQRVETLQIMTSLARGTGWVHHPATNMWRGYEYALMCYQIAICEEWRSRGYVDTCQDKTMAVWSEIPNPEQRGDDPFWLGDPEFHLAHRSNLVRKDPEYYGPVFFNTPDDLPYVWPV